MRAIFPAFGIIKIAEHSLMRRCRSAMLARDTAVGKGFRPVHVGKAAFSGWPCYGRDDVRMSAPALGDLRRRISQ